MDEEAWLGNAAADARADLAADNHGRPEHQLELYEWVRTTASLVWNILIRSHMEACAKDPSAQTTEREVAKEKKKRPVSDMSLALASSPHKSSRLRVDGNVATVRSKLVRELEL